jgi:hypothetical protein
MMLLHASMTHLSAVSRNQKQYDAKGFEKDQTWKDRSYNMTLKEHA